MPGRFVNPVIGIAAAIVALSAAGLVHGGQPDQGTAVGPDTTITLRSIGSALEFVPSRIAVRQGIRVRLVYINQGTLPHNFVLVRDGDDIDLLGMAALDASATGYVPLQHADRMIAHTRLAAPGDSVEVEFTVPPSGEYLFVCLYAGHSNMMIGSLRSVR